MLIKNAVTSTTEGVAAVRLADRSNCFESCYCKKKMSGNVVVCNIDQNLIEELKKFRFSKTKTGCAIIMKVNS